MEYFLTIKGKTLEKALEKVLGSPEKSPGKVSIPFSLIFFCHRWRVYE